MFILKLVFLIFFVFETINRQLTYSENKNVRENKHTFHLNGIKVRLGSTLNTLFGELSMLSLLFRISHNLGKFASSAGKNSIIL